MSLMVNDRLVFVSSAQEAAVTSRSSPPSDDAKQSKIALERAARRARELAERTGTPCYVIRDGRMVDATREEPRQTTSDSAR
jgi:hypothetical protein